jgi:hypothetical protein
VKKLSFIVLVTLATMTFVFTEPVGAAAGRKFYVTKNSISDGSHALQACAPGFHMASIWEILEVSNLRYDRALGFTTADSGFGPPSGVFGWVRTGWTPDVASTPGIGNCDAWRSNNPAHHGTLIELPNDWENISLGIEIGSWHAGPSTCDFETRVWCVQN